MLQERIKASDLQERYAYDPESGLLIRKVRTKLNAVGTAAGTTRTDGYVCLYLRGSWIMAHQAAWVLHYGRFPTGEIDHINGDRSDNRLVNLRDVPPTYNKQNIRRPLARSHLQVLGVGKHGNKFRARIVVANKLVHLGLFATPELAHQAYIEAKRKHHQGNTL